MFVGRLAELDRLTQVIERKKASLIVIKGRRRIGKSRLVEEASKNLRFITLSGIAPTEGVKAEDQRESFARQLSLQLNIPVPRSEDWETLLMISYMITPIINFPRARRKAYKLII